MWHVPDKGSQLGCHIRPVNSGDTDLCPHLGQPDSGSCSPLSFSEGLCDEEGGEGSFNQHDEPCHPFRTHTHALTHTWESGHMLRGSGPAAVPSLVQAYTASCWHMSKEASFDLQQAHPHYAEVAPLWAAGGRNRWKGVHGEAWGTREGRDRQKEKQEIVTLIPKRFFWCNKSSNFINESRPTNEFFLNDHSFLSVCCNGGIFIWPLPSGIYVNHPDFRIKISVINC